MQNIWCELAKWEDLPVLPPLATLHKVNFEGVLKDPATHALLREYGGGGGSLTVDSPGAQIAIWRTQ